MNLSELVKIASSEEKSEEFLRSRGILKTFENCPFCKEGTFISVMVVGGNGA